VALDHLADLGLRLFCALPCRQGKTVSAVTRLVIGCRQQQIPEPGQPRECLAPPAKRNPDTGEFGKTSSEV